MFTSVKRTFKKIVYGLIKKIKILPPKFYVRVYYEYYTGKKLNLSNPVEFNQKIQWLKVYYKPKILNQLVDKYAVRAYVKEKIGAQYLNKSIAVYNSANEVNFDDLPEKFVIKGVHGCHFNLIVKDKSNLNRMKSRLLLIKWMHKNQYYRGGLEWAYKDVKPRLIAEAYLEEMGQEIINDYKFFCFNGKPKFIQVDIERATEHKRCFYDLNWKKLPFNIKNFTPFESELKKPVNFDEMKKLAEKLADEFPFVRVDLYSIFGKTIFGEMTFYPSDGRNEFVPDHYNKIIGDYLKLPVLLKNQKHITTIN